jgi:hypothetical protein
MATNRLSHTALRTAKPRGVGWIEGELQEWCAIRIESSGRLMSLEEWLGRLAERASRRPNAHFFLRLKLF